MEVNQRARAALDRQEPGRALKLLVARVRKAPEDREALDFLGRIYLEALAQPGMEREMVWALEGREDGESQIREWVECLRSQGKEAMAEALEEEAEDAGYSLSLPEVESSEEQVLLAGDEEDADGEAFSEEADQQPRQRETTTAAGGAVGRSGTPVAPKSAVEKDNGRWKRLLVGSLLSVLGITAVVGAAWQFLEARHVQLVADEAMVALDPMNGEATLEVLRDLAPPLGADARAIEERERFVLALVALDEGESAGRYEGKEVQSGWGRAAQAMERTSRGEWEGAMGDVNYLQRAQRDTLPALTARGRICEARGQWVCAGEIYAYLQEHFPEFVAAYQGAMRVAAYRYDPEGWKTAQQALKAVDKEHPYGALGWVVPVGESADWEMKKEKASKGDAFASIWQRLWEGNERLAQGESEQVMGLCGGEEDDVARRLASVQLLCAREGAGRREADVVEVRLERALTLGAGSKELEALVQARAPRWLSDLGRAREGLRFSVPMALGDDAGEDEEGWDEQTTLEPGRGAMQQRRLLARAQALNALGRGEDARGVLSEMEAGESYSQAWAVERLRSHVVEGDLRGAMDVVEDEEDEERRRVLKGIVSYYRGNFSAAFTALKGEGAPMPAVVRIEALSFKADGRRREALATIDRVGQAVEWLSMDSVRGRILARSDGEEDEYLSKERGKEPSSMTTVDVIIDRGAEAFWRREPGEARQWLDRALELAPEHPEAVWKRRLVDRVEGVGGSRRYATSTEWRGDEDSMELLLETGYVHLDFGRYQQARSIFLDALYRDRQELEAIRGLAKAYMGYDPARGRRDFDGLLDNFTTSTADRLGRSEMKRWIAVFDGVREGDESGLAMLQEALEWGGDRPVLLKEKGRYHEAREEWAQAREVYGRALRVEPTSAKVTIGLARTAHAQGEIDEARDYLRQVWRLEPSAPVRESAEALRAALEEAP